MAVKVRIDGDASGLKNASKQAQDALGGITKAGGGTKGVLGQLTGAINPTTLAFSALSVAALSAVKVISDGTRIFLDQAKVQRDLARTIGSTVEQAGMLVEAADDMMISQETLTKAMEGAIRKGYSPTIAGLGAIADKYNAIQDPIAKTKYLMDTFGKSGADMAPMMELGSAAIEGMGKKAQMLGQVLTAEQTRLARESEKSTDALGDAFDTLKKRMAQPFLPIKIFIEEHITKVVEDANALDYAMKELGISTEYYNGAAQGGAYWTDIYGKTIARTKEELDAYIAKQQLRVRWDEQATSQVERLRAGQLALGIPPADWVQNTTTIHTTIERGEASGQSAGIGANSGGGTYTDSEGNRWQYDLLKKKWVMIYKNTTKDTSGGTGQAIGGVSTPGLHMFGEEGPELGVTDSRGNIHVLRASVTRALSKGAGVAPHAIDEGGGLGPNYGIHPYKTIESYLGTGGARVSAVPNVAADSAYAAYLASKGISIGGGGGGSTTTQQTQATAAQAVAAAAASAIPQAVAQGTRAQTEAAQRIASDSAKANAANARTLAQIRDILLMQGGAKDIGREVGKANQLLDSRF